MTDQQGTGEHVGVGLADAVERMTAHLAEVEAWAGGQRSYTNYGWQAPFTHEAIAVMDAQEVVKHSAAAQAWAAVVASYGHG